MSRDDWFYNVIYTQPVLFRATHTVETKTT